MCLGIPGEIIELRTGQPDLARVSVSGVKRAINIGLLSEEALQPGDLRFRVEMTADQLTAGLPVIEEESTTVYRDIPSSRLKKPATSTMALMVPRPL